MVEQKRNSSVTTVSSIFTNSIWKYAIPFYVGWRVWWANRMPIMDCDEVFNYWEPLHFLLYGTGFQTWEYANEFALRTYAYLMPLLGLSKIYQVLLPYIPLWWWPLLTRLPLLHQQAAIALGITSNPILEKVALFVLLRATLAAVMALAEVSFCRALEHVVLAKTDASKTNRLGSTLGLTVGILLLSSAGMSHASGALLPSTSLTLLWLFGASAFLREQYVSFAACAILATLAIGWPFGVLMFVPLGIVSLYRKQKNLFSFISVIIGLTVLIQGGVMFIDYHQYGRWVSAPWNILIYNTQAGGDELYGIEPPSYYVKNLALNFNYVMFGVVALPLCFLWRWTGSSMGTTSIVALLLPMYIWLAVVVPRPHKEERFLFPIYPCLCLAAATLSITSVDLLTRTKILSSPVSPRTSLLIQGILWAPAVLLSFGRTYALSTYYTAPLQVYTQLSHQRDLADSVVCTCGEWYRFPSSFFLPASAHSFGFVQSSFDGQLPRTFQSYGSNLPGPEADPSTINQFNDKNRAEPGSYTDLDDCDYLIDLWTSTDCRENDSVWKPIAHEAFLDAERTTTLHRSIYLPWYHEQEEARGNVQYVDYMLYQRVERTMRNME